MKLSRLTLVAAVALAAPAFAAAPRGPDRMLPGLWEYSYRLSILPLGSERRCLTKAEIDKALSGPCNHHNTCTYSVSEVGDGKARFEGVWVDKKGRSSPISAQGVYGPKTMKLNAHITTTDGLPLNGTIEADWVGPTCSATDESKPD